MSNTDKAREKGDLVQAAGAWRTIVPFVPAQSFGVA